jgi:MoxR-like ATPase
LQGTLEDISPVVSLDQILKARETVKKVYLDEKIEKYILDLVFATREPEKYKMEDIKPLIEFGASPRASINLAISARAHAFLRGRAFVIPEDVRAMVLPVLRHRIGLTYEAEAENITAADLIDKIVNAIPVP